MFRMTRAHATMLILLGFDHTRLTFKLQGRNFPLTMSPARRRSFACVIEPGGVISLALA